MPEFQKPKVFVEVSGGPDSFALLWHKKLEARYRGDQQEVVGLHISWGAHYAYQEYMSAKQVAEICGVELRVLRVESLATNFWGVGEFGGLPILRNVFSIHGLAADYARMHGGIEVANGSILEDARDMPQTRAMLDCLQQMQALTPRNSVSGAGSRLKISAPLLNIDKSTVFAQAVSEEGLEADLLSVATFSCLKPSSDGQQCGQCRACRRRNQALLDAKLPDHSQYLTNPTSLGRI
ncbi:MAG: 7-cyano-7-deazaguanine synthase [Candidatus Shapirobacteria bacterium]|jgi:7-cyano-7-deazaguanine synthase in queuosine biosynthesis